MKTIIAICIITAIILLLILRKKIFPPYPNPLNKYIRGKVFLDQNNAHGDVLSQFDNISSDDCINNCINNSECGGVTWSDKDFTSVCYLNKLGNYLQDGLSNDYAWVKN